MIMLKIGVIIEDDGTDSEHLSVIGEYIAEDLFILLNNGHDKLDTEYLGWEKI